MTNVGIVEELEQLYTPPGNINIGIHFDSKVLGPSDVRKGQ